MNDKTRTGPAGTPDGRGHSRRGLGEQSLLQAGAAFIKNRSWESVVSFNRGACAGGGAQHGFNSEAGGACEAEWEQYRQHEVTFIELLDFLKFFHRKAPFLFFNGNTFADLPTIRRRELISVIAHYVPGVLDREAMAATVDEIWQTASIKPGDRVKTLRGSLHGVIVRALNDGRITWRPDGGTSELIALRESLAPGD